MDKRSYWFDPQSRTTGMLAFMVHRLSGIGLAAYLYLHLILLDKLRRGPEAWDSFLQIMHSPLVTALDAILLFGILIHGLNGLRLTLIGFGTFLRWQKVLFWVSLTMAAAITILGLLAIH